jgi:hypothetical protein
MRIPAFAAGRRQDGLLWALKNSGKLVEFLSRLSHVAPSPKLTLKWRMWASLACKPHAAHFEALAAIWSLCGDSGEAERSFRKEADRHFGTTRTPSERSDAGNSIVRESVRLRQRNYPERSEGRMPLAEKGVRGKGRQPLFLPQRTEIGSAISAPSFRLPTLR